MVIVIENEINNEVQILDEAVCSSLSANSSPKKNEPISSPSNHE